MDKNDNKGKKISRRHYNEIYKKNIQDLKMRFITKKMIKILRDLKFCVIL